MKVIIYLKRTSLAFACGASTCSIYRNAGGCSGVKVTSGPEEIKGAGKNYIEFRFL